MHAQSLRTLGGSVAPAAPRSFRGVGVDVGPSVVLAPSFAPCFTLLREKLPTPGKIAISATSTLVVKGEEVVIEALELDGALVVDVADGGSLAIRSLQVRNAGWQFVELTDAESVAAEEATAIRGFRLQRTKTRTISVKAGEHMEIVDGKARKVSVTPVRLKSAGGRPSAAAIKVEPASRACPSCLLQ